jgi:hypothetical protein
MLQACSQGVDLTVDRHFGEGQDGKANESCAKGENRCSLL